MRRLGSAGLTYTQVFLLVIGFGVASGLIFLFGMWVGRDIAYRQLAREERIVRQPVPVQPTPQEEAKEQDVDRAFYERLKDKAVQRLQDGVAPTPAGVNIGQLAISPTATRSLPPTTERPTPRPSEHQVPRPTATLRPRPTPPETTADEWADAGWTVQVKATTDPEQARELARRLHAKGYDAYTLQAPARGQATWYRVRVGRFASRERAREMEERLKTDEKLLDAYTAPQ